MEDSGGEGKKLLHPLPLHTSQIDPLVHVNRIHAAFYSFAILALFYHRYLQLLSSTTVVSFCLTLSLFFSDAVLAFMWLVTQAFRWRPIRRHPHPERLPNKGLPGLDVFICTADPYKEPPMGVVNTALSVMAYDYPMEKLSVYLSDDGGSDLTLFAFMEAANFAKHWLPFCRMNSVKKRSPEAYFESNYAGGNHQENDIKKMYEKMKEKMDYAMKKEVPGERLGALKKWIPGFTSKEHPTVVQVLLESSKDMDMTDHPLPNLIYVSREKTGASPHHFKGGSLNTLLRVSGEMTNAPFVLNLDCDMKSNDPTTPHQAMCFLLDDAISKTLAFVQFPQRFSGINAGDIYGSEYKRQYLINPLGMNGITGPMYVGSNTFFNRRALVHENISPEQTGMVSDLISSKEVLGRVYRVAGASYELGTKWGSTVGFRYGSLVEDFYTGYQLQCEGWASIFCDPERPAFLGEVPMTLHDALSQTKRWIIGLLEIVFSEHCPLTYGVKHGSLLQGMCYSHNSFWSSWSIPLIAYGILPQIALLHDNKHPLFPNLLRDAWSLVYVYLFLASYAQDAVDFVRVGGGTFRKWWNDQRMWLVRGVTCYPAGIVEFSLNHFGLSPTVGFNVTNKVVDEAETRRYEREEFDLGVASPFMVSVGVFALMSLEGLVFGGVRSVRNGCVGEFGLQLLLCGFVVVNCLPVYAAMAIRKDGGGMPNNSVILSLLITAAFHALAYLTFRF